MTYEKAEDYTWDDAVWITLGACPNHLDKIVELSIYNPSDPEEMVDELLADYLYEHMDKE